MSRRQPPARPDLASPLAGETRVQVPATQRPADVVVTTEGAQLISECFCIYTDQNTAESMAYDQEFGFRLTMIALDLRLSGQL